MRGLVLFALAAVAGAQDILPPELPWNGASEALALKPEDRWVTDCERSGFRSTPRYDATVAWLDRLVAAAPELNLTSLGKSDEGRDIWMVIASKERAFTPEALRLSGKPTFLAVAGIHAGEIDGKDAGMMLLRDLTVRGTKKELLDRANLLFVPIHSVDGHERFSRHARVNQRGPVEMGWRTNSRNLNLNRDFAKLDTPEVRALVGAINVWKPDLYYDIHVTDGADYQYDVTWGYSGPHAHSPAIATWLARHLDPALKLDLKVMGHIPGPLVFAVDGKDMTKGNSAPTFAPRFSNGYGDLRHLPSILVEIHSLKPYRQRVLGTYVLLESTLRVLGQKGKELRAAAEKDSKRRPAQVPLSFKRGAKEPRKVKFLGVEQEVRPEPLTGGERVVWTGKPVTLEIPLLERNVPDLLVDRPAAYWVPPAWREVIARLDAHGIAVERLKEARQVEVEQYRVNKPELAKTPFEGHVRVSAEFEKLTRTVTYPPGTVRVTTDQPLGDLAMHLLEPAAPDSLFRWGFFLEILQRTEYVENYVMVPLAESMLKSDPKLKKAYEERVASDKEFREDAGARLRWFYERTPYFDKEWRIYPVGRELADR
ncbi:MAG: M14 family metallopeptidase [Planctomycetota bacterium]